MSPVNTCERSNPKSNTSVAGRLAAYATAATGAAIAASAGSTASGAVVIVPIAPQTATNSFTISLNAAGLGGGYTFVNDFTHGIYGGTLRPKIDATIRSNYSQFVGTGTMLVGTGVFIGGNGSTGWNGGQPGIPLPGAGETRYLGFRLTVGGGDLRFGWIEYVNNGTSTTVSRWAYESTLNTGITTPTASAVPGAGGVLALAIGAAGIRGRRRGRN